MKRLLLGFLASTIITPTAIAQVLPPWKMSPELRFSPMGNGFYIDLESVAHFPSIPGGLSVIVHRGNKADLIVLTCDQMKELKAILIKTYAPETGWVDNPNPQWEEMSLPIGPQIKLQVCFASRYLQ